jgi:hypothetical protein
VDFGQRAGAGEDLRSASHRVLGRRRHRGGQDYRQPRQRDDRQRWRGRLGGRTGLAAARSDRRAGARLRRRVVAVAGCGVPRRRVLRRACLGRIGRAVSAKIWRPAARTRAGPRGYLPPSRRGRRRSLGSRWRSGLGSSGAGSRRTGALRAPRHQGPLTIRKGLGSQTQRSPTQAKPS